MSAQLLTQQIRWQDLRVRSEVDIVFEIAQKAGGNDCEIFGYGTMITQPQESMSWVLIPADLYKDSIPAEGVGRIHQIINAGIRIQGIIIADDEHRTESPPIPPKPKVSLPSVTEIVSVIRSALLGLICFVAVIALVSLFAVLIKFLVPMIIIGLLFGGGTNMTYDPKLVILVDDGDGGTVWVSVFTWYN